MTDDHMSKFKNQNRIKLCLVGLFLKYITQFRGLVNRDTEDSLNLIHHYGHSFLK